RRARLRPQPRRQPRGAAVPGGRADAVAAEPVRRGADGRAGRAVTGRFETLIYTDCRPGEGLQGVAGLQVQARSADSAAAAEPLVQRYLLYEPPALRMA